MGNYPSLREYVRTLENREKLFRIQREVCRETELHPLVRWQFRGLPGIYKATLKSYTLDGTISRELQEKIVNFQRKQLKVEKEINPESVYDFSILRALNDERKKTGQ